MGVFNNGYGYGEVGEIKNGTKGERGAPGVGFVLDSNGNFNIENKRLTNVKEPINDNDAVNKTFLDNCVCCDIRLNSTLNSWNSDFIKLD